MLGLLKEVLKVFALGSTLAVVGVYGSYYALTKIDTVTTYPLSAKSIVKVLNLEMTGGGTGWVALKKNEKVIVTNDHVCEVQSGGFVVIENDSGSLSTKRVISRNFERDLCIVEGIDAPAITIAKVGPKRFDTLKVLGHPGLRPTAPSSGSFTGEGVVPIGFSPNKKDVCPGSSKTVDSIFGKFCILFMNLGYTTVPIMPGNSGSPVTNEDGEVIGVMNSTDRVGNQGMFIPLPYVKEMLQ